jgi:hypothetical protein
MLLGMPTVEEIDALLGADVRVRLAEAAGGEAIDGRVVGTLAAADGLVVVIEPAGQPNGRLTFNYQHIAAIERR